MINGRWEMIIPGMEIYLIPGDPAIQKWAAMINRITRIRRIYETIHFHFGQSSFSGSKKFMVKPGSRRNWSSGRY